MALQQKGPRPPVPEPGQAAPQPIKAGKKRAFRSRGSPIDPRISPPTCRRIRFKRCYLVNQVSKAPNNDFADGHVGGGLL